MLYLGLREGYRHTSYGTKEVLPGTIERVSKHFRQVRMRADSGYYSQALVNICEQREVEFFIVAKQHRNLMNAVREIPESHWKSFADSDLQANDQGRRRRRRRANLKRKIAIRRKPDSRFKGAPAPRPPHRRRPMPPSWRAVLGSPHSPQTAHAPGCLLFPRRGAVPPGQHGIMRALWQRMRTVAAGKARVADSADSVPGVRTRERRWTRQ